MAGSERTTGEIRSPAPAEPTPAESEASVPARFEQVVARWPDLIAARDGACELTYAALNQAANRVARAIVAARGASPEPIALLFEPGARAVIAILATLKAGKIVVPLDASYPEERTARILRHSRATAVVTEAAHAPRALALSGAALPVLDAGDGEPGRSFDDLGLPIPPDALARIVYTSGSTGHPKGVAHTHRTTCHAAAAYRRITGLGPGDRMAVLSSHGQAAGLLDIFRALLSGATVVPFDVRARGPAALADTLRRERITVYHSTPAVFRALGEVLRDARPLESLRLVHLGGEAVFGRDAELCRQIAPARCVLLHALSSSETGMYRHFIVDPETRLDGPLVPAGYAVADAIVRLLDGEGREVAPGEVGEIAVQSRHLASGYWQDPDLTREAFGPAPDGSGERIYRTGDLGRMRADGCLEHLGRKDAQVKIRGYRVEPVEVEATLLAHPDVRECAVVAKDGRTAGEVRLVAYVACAPGRVTAGELRRFVGGRLPHFMVPSAFVFVEALPYLPGGKVDRLALQAAPWSPQARATAFVAPVQTVEHQVAQIWEELLDVRPVGVRDDFFDLGGNSLLAARMMDRIEQVCGLRLPLSVLLEDPTVEHLADTLLQRSHTAPSEPVTVQQGAPGRQPFFFWHGDFGGGGFYCRQLARALGDDWPFYALAPLGLDGRPVPETIEAMAACYLPAVRAIRPHGPYLLGGHCNGGVVAYEVARLLLQQGEPVGLLALISARAGNVWYRALNRLTDVTGILRGLNREQRADAFRVWRRRVARVVRLRRTMPVRLRRLSARLAVDPVGFPFYAVDRISARLFAAGSERRAGDQRGAAGRRHPREHIHAAYSLALGRYVPGPYPGRVTLFCPQDAPAACAGDPTMGWDRAAGSVEVVRVPGAHLTCITRHVDALGHALRACLERAPAGMPVDVRPGP